MDPNTRIAPSPTGLFHIGTARTAYFNWLTARHFGARFTLRIDDTDRARFRQDWDDEILRSMEWLGLDYDALVRQSDRLERYRQVADELRAVGLAREEDGALRLVGEECRVKEWYDTIAGWVPVSGPELCASTVLVRSDGSPTYHFASVVDDVDLGIGWVIRGIDHLSNTSRHLYVHWALRHALSDYNLTFPTHTHLGLIMRNGKKMSKRDEDSPLAYYVERGYDRDAMLNFLLRLGWGPKADDKSTAVMTVDDALRLFVGGGNMKSNPAVFDQAKLDSFDRKHKGRKERAR